MSDYLPSLKLVENLSLNTKAMDIATTGHDIMAAFFSRAGLSGKRIVIGVGSRHIEWQLDILVSLVRILNDFGAHAIIVPAMGSHGGATSDGQARVIETYGVTEKFLGVPVLSQIDPVEIQTKDPELISKGLHRIYVDSHALHADGVILLNRIKPHTSFDGPIQSGLCKMACIGLGKAKGAAAYHRLFDSMGFSRALPLLFSEILTHLPLLAGIAIVENGVGEVSHLEVLEPQRWVVEEPRLLQLAVQGMPSIPFTGADFLFVDEIGKAVSGSGMDTNVIGLKRDIFSFSVKSIYARSLARDSGGNAVGMGLADIIHSQLLKDVDFPISYINAETSLSPGSVKIPITYPNDRLAWQALMRLGGTSMDESPTVVWIRNTSNLRYMLTNVVCASRDSRVKVLVDHVDIEFDREGNMQSFVTILERYGR